jgi:hypothetical protein
MDWGLAETSIDPKLSIDVADSTYWVSNGSFSKSVGFPGRRKACAA